MTRTSRPHTVVWLVVFVLYISALLYLTIIRPGVFYESRQLNLTVFSGLITLFRSAKTWAFLRLFLGNIGWFVPLGFLLPMRVKKRRLLITLACGLGLSLFIETTQFVFHKGVAELDDLILNLLGTFLGYLFFWLVNKLRRNQSLHGSVVDSSQNIG
ncbi:MAG: VanZ family protein [Propionibacteriaceae bacterium]|nr:VanZ family protein [Propionibacteriaceae bacterium]